eukprot:COSAG02_NODE_45460_length_357_cov_0.589147_1_plen_41_part_01
MLQRRDLVKCGLCCIMQLAESGIECVEPTLARNGHRHLGAD